MSDFYTRMKAYREKLNLSQKKLAEKVNVRRETIVRLEQGKYNPSLKLALDIADELHADINDIFVFAESDGEAEKIFQGKDKDMLEAGHIDLFEQGYQEGVEIGISEVLLDKLTVMVKHAGIFLSEDKWECYKKSEEDKYRKHKEEDLDCGENYGRCYDEQGHLIKEKWVEDQKTIMSCMGFPKDCWEDVCFFVKKYPGLAPEALARRILRESEYKYI